MHKTEVTEIKEINKLAQNLLDKVILEKKDIQELSDRLDLVLAQFGLYKRYFKRLG
jgi:hypothetical protein